MELKEGECGLAGNEIDKSHKSMHICIYLYKSDIREIPLLAAFVKEVCKKIRINPDFSRFLLTFYITFAPVTSSRVVETRESENDSRTGERDILRSCISFLLRRMKG